MTNLYEREDAYIPRVAAIHDLCGYGKCSLGVAIPVLSAAGCDVCPVPTGLFSSHTAFPGWYMHDTTDILGDYLAAWTGIGVEVDAIVFRLPRCPRAGRYIKQVWETLPEALRSGSGRRSRQRCAHPPGARGNPWGQQWQRRASLAPTLTEAAIILGREWRGRRRGQAHGARDDDPGAARRRGAKNVVLKGIEHGDGLIHNCIVGRCHRLPGNHQRQALHAARRGGDVFASTLLAAVMAGRDLAEATAFAADFTADAMLISPSSPASS
ncbi:MAG: pyridoxine kinase, partial [Adlercreutzia equolifaciens]